MDLQNPKLIYFKAALFLFGGLLSAAILILQNPTLVTVAVLALCVWSFARAYYFAFYVIQHYVDPSFKFAGLGSFMRYLLNRRSRDGLRNEGL